MHVFQSMPRVLVGWLPPALPMISLTGSQMMWRERTRKQNFYIFTYTADGAFKVFPGSTKKMATRFFPRVALGWAALNFLVIIYYDFG